MKISRKMARQVEIKIRHGMATGMLPVIERSSTTESQARSSSDKAAGDQGK